MANKLRDTLAAVLFLTVLLVGVLYLGTGAYETRYVEGNARGFAPMVKQVQVNRFHRKSPPTRQGKPVPLTVQELSELAGQATAGVEKSLTGTLDRDHLFIESYGLLQKLQGRRVMEDMDPQYTVVRLSDGSLSFANPDAVYADPTQKALAVAEFRDALAQELDIPLLYVQAPQKVYSGGGAELPDGLDDFGDAHAYMLARTLRAEGVPYLDLRPVLLDTGRYDQLFFATDHHWTPEGALLGWQAVAQTLTEDFGLDIAPRSWDMSAYTTVTYEDIFLGSQGKRVGTLYAGVDDLTAFYPKSYTRFRYEVPTQNYDRTGPFQTSLLFPERLEKGDLYDTNPYTYYSGGDYSFARMKNLQNPDGPKIVLLRDSFACPFAPFMALGCGEVITIDLRYFRDDLMNYIKWVEADMVVMLYSPGSIRLDSMFDFFYQPDYMQVPGRKPLEQVLNVEKPAPGTAAPLEDLSPTGEEVRLD